MDSDGLYRVEFLLRGENIYEADAFILSQSEEPSKKKGGKKVSSQKQDQAFSQDGAPLIPKQKSDLSSKVTMNMRLFLIPKFKKQKGKGRNLRKRKISDDDEQDNLQFNDKVRKLRKGRKQIAASEDEDDEDEDDDEEDDLQGSEDEAKLLELEGKLEKELAHLGEDGEDVDNFEDDEDNEDSEKLEEYVARERPIAKLLKNQRQKEIDYVSDSNISEDPNYQKLTKRQKNIVKNNIAGQQEPEYLELPNNSVKSKKNKFVTEEDQLKKLERDEKRRELMHKQMEDLKRQTVDKILNEAGTKQKKRKEKEEMEKDNKINHQYRSLPENEPRIRIFNSATTSTVSITSTAYHPFLNPNVLQNQHQIAQQAQIQVVI